MSNIIIKCKNCGSILDLNEESKIATCKHCGESFKFSEIFDEEDNQFLEKFSQNKIDNRVKYFELINNANSLVAMFEFEKAEEIFKNAIQEKENDFRPYYGIVRCKTKNFNIVPKDDDYKWYEKQALDLCPIDELDNIKSQFQKLEMLKNEISKKQEKIKKPLNKRKIRQKIMLEISIILLAIVGLILFLTFK